jgi:electron transport complex protein RnfC
VPPDSKIRVVPLKVKYPQVAEKMLIRAIYGVEVPAGKLPLDVETVVNNVGTMAALADYFDHGQPLIERVVTVAGPGIERPANLLVPVGTPVRAVLDYCGGLTPEAREVVMGGPMMGMPLSSLDVPILKGTSGLLAFTEAEARLPNEYTCVRCGRCVEACPNFLNPSRLGRLARAGRYEEMERFHVTDCMECGSCSYACPSGIPIVQLIRVAKSALRERKAAGK